jgi:hypothetical protein
MNELDDEMPLALKKKKASDATALPEIAQNSVGNGLASKVTHAHMIYICVYASVSRSLLLLNRALLTRVHPDLEAVCHCQ